LEILQGILAQILSSPVELTFNTKAPREVIPEGFFYSLFSYFVDKDVEIFVQCFVIIALDNDIFEDY